MPAFSLATLLRALLLWLLFILAESLQGTLRRLVASAPVELATRQVSVLLGVALIFAITWFGWRWMRLRSAAAALATGVLWAGLTFGVEVSLGRALGMSLSVMASAYAPRRGGLMAAGLLAMALCPWAVRQLKNRSAAGVD